MEPQPSTSQGCGSNAAGGAVIAGGVRVIQRIPGRVLSPIPGPPNRPCLAQPMIVPERFLVAPEELLPHQVKSGIDIVNLFKLLNALQNRIALACAQHQNMRDPLNQPRPPVDEGVYKPLTPAAAVRDIRSLCRQQRNLMEKLRRYNCTNEGKCYDLITKDNYTGICSNCEPFVASRIRMKKVGKFLRRKKAKAKRKSLKRLAQAAKPKQQQQQQQPRKKLSPAPGPPPATNRVPAPLSPRKLVAKRKGRYVDPEPPHPETFLSQENFLSNLGLVTPEVYQRTQAESRRTERRRRTTANPKYKTNSFATDRGTDGRNKRSRRSDPSSLELQASTFSSPTGAERRKAQQKRYECTVCEKKDVTIQCTRCLSGFHPECIRLGASKAPAPETVSCCPNCVTCNPNIRSSDCILVSRRMSRPSIMGQKSDMELRSTGPTRRSQTARNTRANLRRRPPAKSYKPKSGRRATTAAAAAKSKKQSFKPQKTIAKATKKATTPNARKYNNKNNGKRTLNHSLAVAAAAAVPEYCTVKESSSSGSSSSSSSSGESSEEESENEKPTFNKQTQKKRKLAPRTASRKFVRNDAPATSTESEEKSSTGRDTPSPQPCSLLRSRESIPARKLAPVKSHSWGTTEQKTGSSTKKQVAMDEAEDGVDLSPRNARSTLGSNQASTSTSGSSRAFAFASQQQKVDTINSKQKKVSKEEDEDEENNGSLEEVETVAATPPPSKGAKNKKGNGGKKKNGKKDPICMQRTMMAMSAAAGLVLAANGGMKMTPPSTATSTRSTSPVQRSVSPAPRSPSPAPHYRSPGPRSPSPGSPPRFASPLPSPAPRSPSPISRSASPISRSASPLPSPAPLSPFPISRSSSPISRSESPVAGPSSMFNTSQKSSWAPSPKPGCSYSSYNYNYNCKYNWNFDNFDDTSGSLLDPQEYIPSPKRSRAPSPAPLEEEQTRLSSSSTYRADMELQAVFDRAFDEEKIAKPIARRTISPDINSWYNLPEKSELKKTTLSFANYTPGGSFGKEVKKVTASNRYEAYSKDTVAYSPDINPSYKAPEKKNARKVAPRLSETLSKKPAAASTKKASAFASASAGSHKFTAKEVKRSVSKAMKTIQKPSNPGNMSPDINPQSAPKKSVKKSVTKSTVDSIYSNYSNYSFNTGTLSPDINPVGQLSMKNVKKGKANKPVEKIAKSSSFATLSPDITSWDYNYDVPEKKRVVKKKNPPSATITSGEWEASRYATRSPDISNMGFSSGSFMSSLENAARTNKPSTMKWDSKTLMDEDAEEDIGVPMRSVSTSTSIPDYPIYSYEAQPPTPPPVRAIARGRGKGKGNAKTKTVQQRVMPAIMSQVLKKKSNAAATAANGLAGTATAAATATATVTSATASYTESLTMPQESESDRSRSNSPSGWSVFSTNSFTTTTYYVNAAAREMRDNKRAFLRTESMKGQGKFYDVVDTKKKKSDAIVCKVKPIARAAACTPPPPKLKPMVRQPTPGREITKKATPARASPSKAGKSPPKATTTPPKAKRTPKPKPVMTAEMEQSIEDTINSVVDACYSDYSANSPMRRSHSPDICSPLSYSSYGRASVPSSLASPFKDYYKPSTATTMERWDAHLPSDTGFLLSKFTSDSSGDSDAGPSTYAAAGATTYTTSAIAERPVSPVSISSTIGSSRSMANNAGEDDDEDEEDSSDSDSLLSIPDPSLPSYLEFKRLDNLPVYDVTPIDRFDDYKKALFRGERPRPLYSRSKGGRY